jgi:outer membrane protein X
MKKIFILVLTSVLCVNVFAQKGDKTIGLNLGYGANTSNPLIGVRGTYNLTDYVTVIPSINHFVKYENVSGLETNMDFTYFFQTPKVPDLYFYPLVGLNYTYIHFDEKLRYDYSYLIHSNEFKKNNHRIAANIGLGLSCFYYDSLILGVEFKYVATTTFYQPVILFNISKAF